MNTIEEEFRAHLNDPVLIGFEVGRAVGYAEDADDCYLIVHYPRRGIVWHTAVGGYIFLDGLKGQNPYDVAGVEVHDDYTRIDSMLSINGCEKVPEFIVDKRPEERMIWRTLKDK